MLISYGMRRLASVYEPLASLAALFLLLLAAAARRGQRRLGCDAVMVRVFLAGQKRSFAFPRRRRTLRAGGPLLTGKA